MMAEEARWSLRLLGHFSLRHRDGEVALTARKAIALLVYLALQPGRTARRDTLATLLWEDVDVAQARVSLRQAIAAVRRVEREGEPLLVTGPDLVTLDAGVAVDTDAFRRLAAGGAADRVAATELYRGDLATGFSVRDAAAFNEWLAIAQAQWRQAAIDLLQALADEALAPGADANAGIAAALKLLAIDAFNEGGHRALMRLYARQGRAARALAQYRGLADLLRQELQVAPDAETQALHEELRAGRRRHDAPAAGMAGAPPPPLPGSASPQEADPAAEAGDEYPSPLGHGPPPAPPSRQKLVFVPRRRAWYLYVGAVAALALVVGGYAAWRLAGPLLRPVPQIARIFPIAASDENEGSPALSPDGNTLVYATNRNGNVDLYAMPVEGQTDPVRLTTDPGIDRSPRWRPDGGALAFVRTAPRRDRPCTILVRLMPTGIERPVGRCRFLVDTRIAWGSDGRTLYFSDDVNARGATHIFRLNVDSGIVAEVTRPSGPVEDVEPAVMGNRLALYRRTSFQAGDLVVHDLLTGVETVVHREVLGVRGLVWSAASNGLFYAVSAGDEAGLWWTAARDGSPHHRLSGGLSSYGSMSAARDGRRLAVQTFPHRLTVRRLPPGVADASGIPPLAMFGTGLLDSPPVEGPDGRLAFVSTRSGRGQVWVGGATGTPQPLTDGRGIVYEQLAWAPNGRFIAASARMAGRTDIFLIDVGTGRLVRISGDLPGLNALPNFSPDGRWLYWSSLRPDRVMTMRVEPGRPGAPKVFDARGIAMMQFSPSRRTMYYSRYGKPGIYRRALDPAGEFMGAEQSVTTAVTSGLWTNWALSGGALVYPDPSDTDGSAGLVRLDLTTGRTRTIPGTGTRQARLQISSTPRGGILLTTFTQQDDILGIDLD